MRSSGSVLDFLVEGSETLNTYRGPYAWASTRWTSYDCSKATCPHGDNVFTVGHNEVQRVDCDAESGTFKLGLRRGWSPPIAHNATSRELVEAIETMPSIGKVTVSFADGQVAEVACGANQSFFVEFLSDFGRLPLLSTNTTYLYGANASARVGKLGSMDVARYQRCTKENVECGGQGICDRSSGMCTCLFGLTSGGGSNVAGKDSYGRNAYGHRGDCGFRHTDTSRFDEQARYN